MTVLSLNFVLLGYINSTAKFRNIVIQFWGPVLIFRVLRHVLLTKRARKKIENIYKK